MKRKILFLSVVMLSLVFAGCQKNDQIQVQDNTSSLKSASINNKYIVVLNEDAILAKSDLQTRNASVKAKALGLLKKFEITGEVEEVYETALQGFTVKMAPGQAKKMGEDPDVKYVEPDQVIALSPIELNGKPSGGGTTQPAQTTPWGIGRVGGVTTYTGSNVAWIIDTGIDYTHPDLLNLVDTKKSKTFISRTSSANDDNGHGTHVAGIIAALNNDIGVIGVAPGAHLVAVKVLDSRGSGTTSGVIAGVDYVAAAAAKGDVANMSLGGGVSTSLDAAVLTASANVKFALAAGNETDYASNHSPARVNGPNIYTVSAIDFKDNWASWSNFSDARSSDNSPIDYCAPGVSILSCYKGGGYATMSGTSMAAPHVAGLLILGVIKTDGTVIGDPSAPNDAIAHH